MKRVILWLCFIGLSACSNQKKYEYVETTVYHFQTISDTKKEEKREVIYAESDSAAYLAAYQKFAVSVLLGEKYKKAKSPYYEPIDYALYRKDGTEISKTIDFQDKKVQEERLLSVASSVVKDIASNSSASSFPTIDSAKVKDLTTYFRLKKDEFSPDGQTWYHPKSAPQYANMNGLYAYFQTVGSKASNFRFSVQYYADEWLFFHTIQFSIDGKAYEYTPARVETDNNGGHIWEWFDETVSGSDKPVIEALANAKSAKMKLIGRQYYKVKPITNEQIIGLKRTLELYKALGGYW